MAVQRRQKYLGWLWTTESLSGLPIFNFPSLSRHPWAILISPSTVALVYFSRALALGRNPYHPLVGEQDHPIPHRLRKAKTKRWRSFCTRPTYPTDTEVIAAYTSFQSLLRFLFWATGHFADYSWRPSWLFPRTRLIEANRRCYSDWRHHRHSYFHSARFKLEHSRFDVLNLRV
jgi:hypothetical protein